MDTKIIKQVIDIFEHSDVHKLEVEDKDIKIKLEKENHNIVTSIPFDSYKQSPAVVQNNSADLEKKVNVKEKEDDKGNWVKSPLVGTFYSRANENANEYVSVGESIKKGDTICIIEAMKVMNEIKAPSSGTVLKVNKTDGEMVQFDDNLVLIGE
ncbi:acetyl-CoA carboxylase biotin carboxyl carrier protein [Anaerofustis stercorihominis]|uniref:acetyl-CoA carboxylase biotin carboxyl carrier protein n=1 Tax=Anaerofustis stercorihominis TaxID=214853 RepID=UPI0015F32ECC|nr:acetyl-CoA carboxylase biotin carboxyl carrier protein [Anaerofustis stercorihominis]